MIKTSGYFHNVYELTKRNLLIFVKNKTTVFFSLLAPILMLVIYGLFMSDLLQTELIINMLPQNSNIDANQIKQLTDAWMVSGIIGIASLTVALNCMFVIISDKERKVIDDFSAAPIKLINLTLSYFLSAFILTFLICIVFLAIGVLYLVIFTAASFTLAQIMHLILILFVSTISAVIILMFIAIFINTTASAASFTGIFSALIGFLIGSYLPVGLLPEGIANFANLIPGSHSNSLYRSIFMESTLNSLSESTRAEVSSLYGIRLNLFGHSFTNQESYVYLLGSIVIFFGLYILVSKIKEKIK